MSTLRITYSLAREPVRNRPIIESPPDGHTTGGFTCAYHIRGRIDRTDRRTSLGYMRFIWQVVNTRTGQVLIESDAVGWTDAVRAANEATFIARGAYFWDLMKKGMAR